MKDALEKEQKQRVERKKAAKEQVIKDIQRQIDARTQVILMARRRRRKAKGGRLV